MDKKLMERLEPVLNTDPGHQARVEAWKAELAEKGQSMAMPDLFPLYAAARKEKARLEAELSDVQVRVDGSWQLLRAAMADAKQTAFTAENGEKIRIEPTLTVAFVDPAAFREWCMADDDLVLQFTLHSSKAMSVVKKRLEAGLDEPPGTVANFWDKPVYTPLVPLKARRKKGEANDGGSEGAGSETGGELEFL